jgi:hypothetical protein
VDPPSGFKQGDEADSMMNSRKPWIPGSTASPDGISVCSRMMGNYQRWKLKRFLSIDRWLWLKILVTLQLPD